MKIIVYKTGEGVAIITPCNDFYIEIIDIDTPAEIEPSHRENGKEVPSRIIKPREFKSHKELILGLERAKKDIPEGAEYKIMDASEIPMDRTFRDAWDFDFKVAIPTAKEIHKTRLRIDRLPFYEINDILLRDAFLESDSKKKSKGIKERDRLRDITKKVDTCKTAEDIKAVTL
jgi:hypothetical protein